MRQMRTTTLYKSNLCEKSRCLIFRDTELIILYKFSDVLYSVVSSMYTGPRVYISLLTSDKIIIFVVALCGLKKKKIAFLIIGWSMRSRTDEQVLILINIRGFFFYSNVYKQFIYAKKGLYIVHTKNHDCKCY